LIIFSPDKFTGRFLLFLVLYVLVKFSLWLVPATDFLNFKSIDYLFILRSHFPAFAPVYSQEIVHVDLDDTTSEYFQRESINRSHLAQMVANLNAMKVRAQAYDFIFAVPTNKQDDSALIKEMEQAGNVYIGMAFDLQPDSPTRSATKIMTENGAYLTNTSYKVKIEGLPEKQYSSPTPLPTFLPLSMASKGMGFLNLTPDRDGVFRRVPLLIRYKSAHYPSLPLRLVCDRLNITKISYSPGKHLTLEQENASTMSDSIRIPIDNDGKMIVNFIGRWEAMSHYHFSDVWKSSNDMDMFELWMDELEDKIVIVSDVTTGSADIGPVPMDLNFPLSGVIANAMHTILTGKFIRELDRTVMVMIELTLVVMITAFSFFPSMVAATGAILAVSALPLLFGTILFLRNGLIIDFVTPISLAATLLFAVHLVRGVILARKLQRAKFKRILVEKELEIGRKIQQGFFPEELPTIPGWEIDAFFRPARQVAGDFYDAFPLNRGKQHVIVIADVCDKGVGAALFMALTRSLIRAFIEQNLAPSKKELEAVPIREALEQTVLTVNNYIAITHDKANMFATLFLGVLESETGSLHYMNCGHEPPLLVRGQKVVGSLNPTGPAVGAMPDLDFFATEVEISEDMLLFAFTDGVTDAQNSEGELFSKERLLPLLTGDHDSVEGLLAEIVSEIDRYVANDSQFDDITMIAFKNLHSTKTTKANKKDFTAVRSQN